MDLSKEQASIQIQGQKSNLSLWTLYQNHPKLILAVVIFLGLFLRWYNLGESRPIHHDESLHGMYSLYGYDRPETNFYKYQPLLHGPLLFNTIPWAFDLLGKTDFSIRFPMALMGSLMLFLPLLFRRYLNPFLLLSLTLFMALSPELVYWSRFSREDYFMVLALVCILAGITLDLKQWAPIVTWFGLGWMMCVKESSFVFLAIFLGYLIFETIFLRLVLKDTFDKTLFHRLTQNAKRYPTSWIVGFLAASFFFCALYSAGFKYQEGILDGLYRKSIMYWWEQHSIERIKGPFSYSFFVMTWYDLPWTLVLMGTQLHFYWSKGAWWKKFYAISIILSFLLSMATSGIEFEKNVLLNFFKLKIPFDVFLCLLILINSVVVPALHLKEKKYSLSFFGYWFFANFFTYGYLGEKVPWLALYPFLAGLIYFSIYWRDQNISQLAFPRCLKFTQILKYLGLTIAILYLVFALEEREPLMVWGILVGFGISLCSQIFKKKNLDFEIGLQNFILMTFSLFTLRTTIMTNFGRAGEQHQIMGQVHTTWEMHHLLKDIRKQYFSPLSGKRPTIYLQGDALWPVTWYLHSIPTYRFSKDENPDLKYDYAFLNLGDPQAENFRKTHQEIIVPLRGWWVPDYKLMTLRKFLLYTFFHLEWNPIGNFNLHFFSKKAQTNGGQS